MSHICVLRTGREYLVSFPDSLPHSAHGTGPGYEAREYPQLASLIPRLSRNANMYPERGSLGTRL